MKYKETKELFLILFKKFPLISFSHAKPWEVIGTPAKSTKVRVKKGGGAIFTRIGYIHDPVFVEKIKKKS